MGRSWTVAAFFLSCTSLACLAQQISYPDLSGLLSKSYRVDVELTRAADNESEFVREYHDRDSNTGYMEVLFGGMTSYMYYFLETDEEVTIFDNTCTIQALSKANATIDGKTVYTGPSAGLHELPASVMTYVNDSTIRGVATRHFQGNFNNKQYDVYIRVDDWMENGVKKTSVPVRLELFPIGNATKRTIYDFYNFEPYKPKIGDMNLKTGIGCQGKQNPPSKTLPTIPNQISFQYEIYYQDGSKPEHHVTVNKIWLDATNKVARVELFPVDSKDETAEIHDFNSGVMYRFDKEGSCVMDHLSKSIFAKTLVDREIYTMKTPAEMLELVGNFYYAGQALVRGVACDIWESVRTNVTVEYDTYTRVVTTFYFTSLQWFSAGHKVDKFVPLRRETAGSKEDFMGTEWMPEVHAVNYFDFVEEDKLDETFLWNLDIRACFVSKTYLDLLFVGDRNVSHRVLNNNHDTILETVWEKLYTLPQISPLRIPKPQVGFLEDGSIHIVALLLPPPDALASFTGGNNRRIPGDQMKHLVKMSSQETCAQECLNDPGCLTFFYCDHECFFSQSKRPQDWGSPLFKTGCRQYWKSDNDVKVTFKTNPEVVNTIKDEVDNGRLLLKVADQEEQKSPATFTAVRIKTDASPFNAKHAAGLYDVAYPEKTLSLSQDTTVRATTLDGSNAITSVQQCYRNCISESGTDCTAFSYCPDTKDCRLTSVYVLDDDVAAKSLELDTRCNVYSRSYINFYEKFAGSVSRVGGDLTQENIKDENECAKECKHNKLIRCRGFEYCPGTKHCVLHVKHFLDINPEDVINGSEACSHYAQRFSADYWEGARKELVDPNSVTVTLISLEDCAKQCTMDPTGQCKSFNFCPDDGPDRRCVLNTLTVYDKSAQYKESKTCLFYFQQDHINDLVHFNLKRSMAPSASGYTSGGLGGLLFGMLILGLVLGLVGYTAFNYIRMRRAGSDNTTVRFVRHEEESG